MQRITILLLAGLLLLTACGNGDDVVISRTPEISDNQTLTTPAPTLAPPTSTPLPTSTIAVAADTVVESVPTETPTATPAPTATPSAQLAAAINLVPIASGFQRPVYLTHADDNRLFVIEQRGVVHIVIDGIRRDTPFLDLTDRVGSSANEQGLLSIAFHPSYGENGRFYAYYTDVNGTVIIARFEVSDDPNIANRDSMVELMRIGQPFFNHNGGQLAFGPDGMLYAGVGDGGSANDPQLHGQNLETLLGTILRLDVDGGEPYAVPADNPYVADESVRNEIWSWGLRNPWRFSFDQGTGDLFVSDVGQGRWEEVNFQSAENTGGDNYGWNFLEGNHCFASPDCDLTFGVAPIVEYNHDNGDCSVTGGYVYRGNRTPNLTGNYLYGDYCSARIWAAIPTADGWQSQVVFNGEFLLSSFGEGVNGELYVLAHDTGVIYQVSGN